MGHWGLFPYSTSIDMRYIFKFLLSCFAFIMATGSFAQTYVTNSPDSVCAGAQDVLYRIPPPAGTSPTVYNWSITGTGFMSVMAAPVNDSILVDWPNTVGVDTVKVFQSNGGGCVGPTAALPVVRYKPTATLSGATATICAGTGINNQYTITFTGRPPYSVTYQFTSGANTIGPITVNNITSTTYIINIPAVANAGTYAGSITTASDKSCPATVAGSATLNVITQPGLPVIQHID